MVPIGVISLTLAAVSAWLIAVQLPLDPYQERYMTERGGTGYK